ncbi:hypothetical protein DFP72DRAFT_495850 [Ephemerocybe angulata]|uniref:RING-type domain-containing protein n=1 Tax=Ephemerocybe angulata TaxID=980116 RepID=A0A8H6HRC0_9AGAR|nr:hypothetical protein DFP72DRAFT_495850 [Tulosesus angulatus]
MPKTLEESGPPVCPICIGDFDPVERPPKIITCGHVYCSSCLDKEIQYRRPCAFRCRGCVRLQHRDARYLSMSIVVTTPDEDQLAVISVKKAHLVARTELQQIEENRSRRIRALSFLISNQLGSLSRLSTATGIAVEAQEEAVATLRDAQETLSSEIEREEDLIQDFNAIKEKLEALHVRQAELSPRRSMRRRGSGSPALPVPRGVKRTNAEVSEGGSDQPAKRMRTEDDLPVSRGAKRTNAEVFEGGSDRPAQRQRTSETASDTASTTLPTPRRPATVTQYGRSGMRRASERIPEAGTSRRLSRLRGYPSNIDN